MTTGTVYGIHNGDGVIRYVGATRRRLATRLMEHRGVARRRPHTRLHQWLLEHPDTAAIVALQVDVAEEDLAAREVHWVAHFRAHGDLLNQTAGGPGMQDPDPEVREALRQSQAERAASAGVHWNAGRTLTPEHRAKIAEAGKGRSPSEETREKLRQAHTGRTFSEESLAKMRAAQQVRPLRGPLSEEHKAKIAAAKTGRTVSEETRERMRLAAQAREAAKRAARNAGPPSP